MIGNLIGNIPSLRMIGWILILVLIIMSSNVAGRTITGTTHQATNVLQRYPKIGKIIENWVQEKYPEMEEDKKDIVIETLMTRIEIMIQRRNSWSPWKPGEDMFARMLK